MAATSKQRRWQFSLRGLLALVTVATLVFGWFSWRLARGRLRDEAAEAIIRAGGQLAYANQFRGGVSRLTPGPYQLSQTTAWLQSHLGVDPFLKLVSVTVHDDATASVLSKYSLTNLEVVRLEGPGVTDAGLTHIHNCNQVHVLVLDEAKVTDRGLDNIAGYKRLEELWINRTAISDVGVEKIAQLRSPLSVLDLRGTQITDEGLRRVATIRGIQYLLIDSQVLTDEGFKALAQLPDLETLYLGDTSSAKFDLAALNIFPKLRELFLTGPLITDDSVKPLINNRQIEVLRLQACSGLTDETLVTIATFPKLRYFECGGTPFSIAAKNKFVTEHPACAVR